jgi:hypothetical protein
MAINVDTQVRSKSTGKIMWVNDVDPARNKFKCGPTFKSADGEWLRSDQFDVLPNGPLGFSL